MRKNRYVVLPKDFEKAYKKAIKKTEQSQMLWKQVGVMSVAVMSTLRKRVPHLHTMG